MLEFLVKAALLIIAVIGVACGSRSADAGETGVIALGDPQVLQTDDFRLAEEVSRRKSLLSDEHFTVFDPLANPELDVPSEGESMISLWFETAQGSFVMELSDPDGQPVVSWQRGRRGEQTLVRMLVPGKYVVKLQAIDAARVHGVIGVKVLPSSGCPINGDWLTEYHPSDPAAGYSWPYLLVRPAKLPGAGTLLVVPNNTGEPTEDLPIIRAMASCALSSGGDINAVELANSLGTPVLMPLFPRPELQAVASNLELQALTRASLEEVVPRFARVDLQLMAMIDAARRVLAAENQPVRSRVLMAGLSAAGSFSNRFTLMHPDRVLAAAVGSPGGWPLAPVAADQGKKLRYPVGIADLKKLSGQSVDLAALRRVHFLFFLGDRDTNDAVGSRDSFAPRDSDLIKCLFGATPIERWDAAHELYDRAGISAQFKIYPGNHEVTPAMRKDIEGLFRNAIRTALPAR